MDAPTSLYEWLPRSNHAPHLKTHRLAGSAECLLSTVEGSPPGDYSDPPVAELGLTMALRPCRARVRQGGRPFEGRAKRGSFVVAPVMTAADIETFDRTDIFTLSVPEGHARSLVEGEFRDDSLDFGPLHERFVEDSVVRGLLLGLAEEADADSARGAAFVDYAVAAIVLRLARLAQKARKGGEAASRPLDAATLARVTALLEERLEEAPGLTALAAEAGVEPTRFVKAFKAATGLPPHQYLLERRVERARELLVSTDQSIADVAFACGFSSQQHLTNTFSKRLGVTPARLRKEAA